jgi:hypothetical protein
MGDQITGVLEQMKRTLPDKLSDLVEVALQDLNKVEALTLRDRVERISKAVRQGYSRPEHRAMKNITGRSFRFIVVDDPFRILLQAGALVACSMACTPEQKYPPREEEAGLMCDRYRELGCPEGKPTAKGKACEVVVTNAAEAGIDLIGDVACVERADDCEQVRACTGGSQ